MLFYDFEVFKFDWLVVIVNMLTKTVEVIVNDPDRLKSYYEENKSNIWIGFNNNHYDQYIMKSILCDLNPKECNDFIIKKEIAGYRFSNLFRNIKMLNYDVMQKTDRGLKTFEGFLGDNIKETSIPFDIDRKLTDEEIQETVKYCRHDVEETIKVFLERIDEWNAVRGLIKMFPEDLSMQDIGLTKAQMSAKILGCEYKQRNDEFDLYVLDCIQIRKYQKAIQFFLNTDNHNYSCSMELLIAGLLHTIAWGGIHAGKEKYHRHKKQGKQMWHVDVASFYPRLMIFHDLLTRNTQHPEKFRQIYEKRIELKKAGKKKEQAPLKIVINGTYGISKAPTSKAYDPRNANLICLNGQLMLIDLIEHLEKIDGFELIQSNTDGLIVAVPDTDEAFEQMDDICYEWESRCNMELEFDEINEIYQKDVNNYIFEFSNGKIEKKGAYVKELSSLDYDLPIVNKAIVDYMVHRIPVETTINKCDDLKEFQMVKKISSKYSHILHGGMWVNVKRINPATGKMKTMKEFKGNQIRLNEKCIRVFASVNSSDGGVWKVKKDGSTAKIESTPEHCFIYNDSVNGVSCPNNLDKQWYINVALERLAAFGVESYRRR